MQKVEKLKFVRLKYMHDCPNAGDYFSFVLAQHYFSDNVISYSRKPLTVPNLIFIGSFLRNTDKYTHICGAGCVSSDPSVFKLPARPRAVHCLRGPMTAEVLRKLGVSCPDIFGDPGILAPELYPRKVSPDTKIGIIPHHLDADLPWVTSCRKRGIKIIDVLSPLDDFFRELHRCEVVLSSSLHGIIFAHAYGIPALWIELSDNVIGYGFKYFDYYMSIGVSPEKVCRIRINAEDKTDPYEIAKLATTGDHSKLIAPLKEAIRNAIEQLRRDQKISTIKNILLPLNSHNYEIATNMMNKFLKKVKWYQELKKYIKKKLKRERLW